MTISPAQGTETRIPKSNTVTRKTRFLELAPMADHCPGFAMCRTDFLGVGICSPGEKRKYAAFYPQGRLRVVSALRRNKLPITPAVIEIAKSCTGCRICDKQCFFTAELQPFALFEAFADYVSSQTHAVVQPPEDSIIPLLQNIVGQAWASNDPAICFAYGLARSPEVPETVPRCVALPGTTQEVAAIVKLCVQLGVPWVARGSGTGPFGAITEGLVIDMTRMDRLEIDKVNWCADIGPGVSAFALQQAAWSQGLLANVAEPAACVCSNILTTNMHSLFSYAYGLGADHVLDAEFVDAEGKISRLSEHAGPSPLQYRAGRAQPLGICTGMSVRLFPRSPTETAALVPFAHLDEAVEAARSLASKRIGVGLGIIGTKYISLFAGHSASSADDILAFLKDDLGIECFLQLLGEPSAMSELRSIFPCTIDGEMIPRLLRALPKLRSDPAVAAVIDLDTGPGLYKRVFSDDMRPILDMVLCPSDDEFDSITDPFQRDFFGRLFSRPEMSDMTWLNRFRILPARMGRGHQFVAQIAWLSLDPASNVRQFTERLSDVGLKHGLQCAFGYVVPIDNGTRAVTEFDLYFDHTNAREREKAVLALADCKRVLQELVDSGTIICTGADLIGKGIARYQSYLFAR